MHVYQTIKELTITLTTCNILHAAGRSIKNNILVQKFHPKKVIVLPFGCIILQRMNCILYGFMHSTAIGDVRFSSNIILYYTIWVNCIK